MHTKFSGDGIIDPGKITAVLDKRGLKGVAVTDHNSIRGGVLAWEAANRQHNVNHIIIVGTEITTEIGHIIGLFLSREIRSRYSLEVLDEIRSQGGISILAHPFRTPYIFRSWTKKDNVHNEGVLRKFDLIEVLNARSKTGENLKAAKLAENLGKPVSAGSDAHFYPEIGAVTTAFEEADTETEEDVKRCLLLGKVEVQTGRTFLNNFHWYALSAMLSYSRKFGLGSQLHKSNGENKK